MNAAAPAANAEDDHDVAALFGRVFELNETLLAAASGGEWDRLNDLHAQRQRWLDAIFSRPIPAALVEFTARALQQTLEVNQQIASIGITYKLRLVEELDRIQKGKRAAVLYTDTAAGG